MSAPEDQQQFESKGSVKITRNAKGDAQFEVKVYVGEPEAAISTARQIAESQYRQLETTFASASA